jgi:hypothetical protein
MVCSRASFAKLSEGVEVELGFANVRLVAQRCGHELGRS